VWLAAVVVVTVGCGAPKPVYFHGGEQLAPGASVAVLPLVNLSRYENAADIIGANLVVELLATGQFEVVDPGVVDNVVLEKRMRLTDRLPLAALQDLGSELDVSYVVVGAVNEFDFIQEGTETYPTVSISLRMVRCADGVIIWAATHSKRGDDRESVFGLGRVGTLEQLAEVTVREVAKTLVAR